MAVITIAALLMPALDRLHALAHDLGVQQATAGAHPHASEGMVARYEQDGFLYVPGVLSEGQVAAALRAVEFAYTQPPDDYAGKPQWMRPRTYRWHDEHYVFVELLSHPLVVDLARKLIGPHAHAVAAQCSRISPYAGTDRGKCNRLQGEDRAHSESDHRVLMVLPGRGHSVPTMHIDTPFLGADSAQVRAARPRKRACLGE